MAALGIPPLSPSALLPKGPSLSLREKISYGLGDVGNALAVSSVSFWLLIYFTDVAGLDPGMAGIAMMIGRVWDAIFDPIVGWITDRTQSKWGKRRPFLLYGAIPYACLYCAIWMVPDFASQTAIFAYVTIILICFNTCFAFIIVPYASLTASMTSDYHERLSLTAFRMVASQSAFLVGAALPSALVFWVTHDGEQFFANSGLTGVMDFIFGSWAHTPRQGYAMFALSFGLLMVCSCWICFWGVRERTSAKTIHAHDHIFAYTLGIISALKHNKPYRMAVSILCMSECAAALVAINMPYFIQYVLKLEGDRTKILLSLFIGAIVAVPFWNRIARRYGKSETFTIVVRTYVLFICLLPFLPVGQVIPAMLLAFCGGICHSAALMIPWSMIPDVVEYDELHHGSRREGLFYGGALFSYKLATAVGVGLSGLSLKLVGYVANTPQSDNTILGMKVFICFAPSLFLISASLIAARYPLTAAKHQEILQQLDNKRAKETNS